MKVDEIKAELAKLAANELQEKIELWRRDLFTLKINATTSHIKDYSQFRKLRKNIARGLTRQQELANNKR